MIKNIVLTSLVFVFILGISQVAVEAGFLNATSAETAAGTTFTLSWSQGFNSGTVYYYRNAFTSSRVASPLIASNLNLGPNSCNINGQLGNMRAIHVQPAADAGGPYVPDAVINCDICPCEPGDPETNFTCVRTLTADQYSCLECNGCSRPGRPACPAGTICRHQTCTTNTCVCTDAACSALNRACDGNTETTCTCSADRTACNCQTRDCSSGGGLPPACSASCSCPITSTGIITRCTVTASNNIDDYKVDGSVSGWSISSRTANRFIGTWDVGAGCLSPGDFGYEVWVNVLIRNSLSGDEELACSDFVT
jgi:hypothetical protein